LLLRLVEKLDELGISVRKVLAVFSPKGTTAVRLPLNELTRVDAVGLMWRDGDEARRLLVFLHSVVETFMLIKGLAQQLPSWRLEGFATYAAVQALRLHDEALAKRAEESLLATPPVGREELEKWSAGSHFQVIQAGSTPELSQQLASVMQVLVSHLLGGDEKYYASAYVYVKELAQQCGGNLLDLLTCLRREANASRTR